MDRDLIPCQIHSPTPEQLRFSASVALGDDERYLAKYNVRSGVVDLISIDDSPLPRNLFLTSERYELNQVHPVTSARLCFVEPAAWQEACLAVLAEIQAQAECDHGAEEPVGRYEITMPQGSVRTNNLAVAQALHSALHAIGARPRLRDLTDKGA